ncbi:MAG TPA: IS3 family transposase [Gemmatimonadales bacterium]|nr:IS3 family transposase [Gemmatimonadales bacterium]
MPNPEVPEKPKRRQFTAEYKRSIVAQAEACRDDGAIGGLLRREGLYSSHLTTWRRQKEQGEFDALTPKKRGRKSTANPLTEENQRLRKENARLSRRLEQAELIIDVQKKGIGPAGDLAAGGQERRGELMTAAHQLGQTVGRAAACRALNVPRASLYRHLRPSEPATPAVPRPSPPRALAPAEQQRILDVLHSERFQDKAPNEVFAALLDEGTYLCSVRTMYRILEQTGEVRERRAQLRHPNYQKPQLLATSSNQVWSWDITKLLGPVKWTYFYLYVILDIFSRYVVGWMVAERESAELAKRLIGETCRKQNIAPDQLTIHADRGTSMTSKPVALLLADLGVAKTHSRPHVSDDNPFSESQFKTLKYRPEFPERFGSIQDARAFCQSFFPWYNTEHHHSGIGLLTPEVLHYGRADEVIAQRQVILSQAFQRNPERFVRAHPRPPVRPTAVWINPPSVPAASEQEQH